MKNKALILMALLFLAGCETTSTRPYTASTQNVISMQNKLSGIGKLKLGEFTENKELGSLLCRLNGDVDVSPGKTQSQYIRDAIQTELFMAQVYDEKSNIILKGNLNSLSFSSTSPAYWLINMSVSSNKHDGYVVETKYPFSTSFSAWGACKNVADAFAPAIQKTISDMINNPKFNKLIGKN